MADLQGYFHQVATALEGMLHKDEVTNACFEAEESDFVRLNKTRVRQAGSVTQRQLSVDLIQGKRHATASLTLAGDLELDRPRLEQVVKELRERVATLPEDPYLLYSTEVRSSEKVGQNQLPAPEEALGQIREAGEGKDMVGIYAAGGIHRGFASSLGQRNWYSTWSFNLDWTFYHQADKAVKEGYAGFRWDPAAFERKVRLASEKLAVLGRPARTIDPGRYTVYLSPAAVQELVTIMSWGGFGLKDHRTKQTPLLKMVEGGARLAPGVTLRENTAEGVAPNFQEQGFFRPDHVDLIVGGAYKDCLVSPRSSREYGVPTNGATSRESPLSVDLAPGALPEEKVMDELGTGVWVGNLWYLNFSDRSSCRTTGMTRFATFWVEKGQIAAPLNVMRFDETIYRVLGENLRGLTREREMILDAQTYDARSTTSAHLPGALVDEFTFTL